MNNHSTIKENIRPGDILLSRKKKAPISKIIGGITRSNWSHTFFYIGDGKIIESDWNGVLIRPLNDYLNNSYDVGLFRLKEEKTTEEIATVVKTARKKVGLCYGYIQLLWYAILRLFGKSEDKDWAFDVDHGMVCSELVAYAYESIDVHFKDLPPHQIEPADIDESNATIRIA